MVSPLFICEMILSPLFLKMNIFNRILFSVHKYRDAGWYWVVSVRVISAELQPLWSGGVRWLVASRPRTPLNPTYA